MARENVSTSTCFPKYVLKNDWTKPLFFNSDIFMSSDFVSVIAYLRSKEKSSVACLLNLNRLEETSDDFASVIYLDDSTTAENYQEALKEDHDGIGWLYRMDRYFCISEVASWCIYLEKNNEVGVIAFGKYSEQLVFDSAVEMLCARPIEHLLSDPTSAPFPFDSLVPEWASNLRAFY